MKKFIIVRSTSLEKLSDEVNSKMEDGYIPLTMTSEGDYNAVYTVPMVVLTEEAT